MASEIIQEFLGLDLGDERLNRRAIQVVEACAARPEASFPKSSGSVAALEGSYRFLGNPKVSLKAILAPHLRATAFRASSCDEVVVVHDTTQFRFEGDRTGLGYLIAANQGYFAHCSLVLDGREGRPLGSAALTPIIRKTPKKPKQRKESARWFVHVEKAERVLKKDGIVHVMDREADSYELFAKLKNHRRKFVIRACHDRLLADGGESPTVEFDHLFEALEAAPVRAERRATISKRKPFEVAARRNAPPAREARPVRLHISSTRVELLRPRSTDRRLPDAVSLNAVRVIEVGAPDTDKPIEWLLLTTEPVNTAKDALRVVDLYRKRWTIEEYFKALKTGCAYEKRQLQDIHSLLNALAVFVPIAWQLLLLRSRARKSAPPEPATGALSQTQLDVLAVLTKRSISQTSTLREAMLAVAALGGHIPNNGDPGWQVLGRGLHDLLLAERAWIAAREM